MGRTYYRRRLDLKINMTWSNDSLIAYGRGTIDTGEELLRAGRYLCIYTRGKIEYVSISTFLKVAKQSPAVCGLKQEDTQHKLWTLVIL